MKQFWEMSMIKHIVEWRQTIDYYILNMEKLKTNANSNYNNI